MPKSAKAKETAQEPIRIRLSPRQVVALMEIKLKGRTNSYIQSDIRTVLLNYNLIEERQYYTQDEIQKNWDKLNGLWAKVQDAVTNRKRETAKELLYSIYQLENLEELKGVFITDAGREFLGVGRVVLTR